MDIHVRRLAMQRRRSDGSCAAKSCISGTCSGNVSDMNVQATGIADLTTLLPPPNPAYGQRDGEHDRDDNSGHPDAAQDP